MISSSVHPPRHARLFELIRQGNLAEETRERHVAQVAEAAVDMEIARLAGQSLMAQAG